jgi:hypothetical protein
MARVEQTDLVVNEQGRPVANVLVTINPVAGSSGTSKLWQAEEGAGEVSTVVTNSVGVYSVWLDEGRYDIHPAGTKSKRVEIVRQQPSYPQDASGNIAIGSTLPHLTTAEHNTALGVGVSVALTTGNGNTVVGHNAGKANTTGNFNTYLGLEAGSASVTGSGHTAVGAAALRVSTATLENTALGFQAGQRNTSGNFNAFIGSASGEGNTTGSANTIVGSGAAIDNQIGNENVVVGFQAASKSETSWQTVVGSSALEENKTGISNTVIGFASMRNHTGGSNNTAIGRESGENNLTGNANVFIGFQAGKAETGSNKLYIANTATAEPLIGGDFSVGEVTINGKLGITGLLSPQQHATAGAPAYVKGAIYFDTTLNKLRVGGATAWETVTSV